MDHVAPQPLRRPGTYRRSVIDPHGRHSRKCETNKWTVDAHRRSSVTAACCIHPIWTGSARTGFSPPFTTLSATPRLASAANAPLGLAVFGANDELTRLASVSDVNGYRYQAAHPVTGRPWPALPPWSSRRRSDLADVPHPPEACLINHVRPTAKMGCTRTAMQEDFRRAGGFPVVGDTCVFRYGGEQRRDQHARSGLASATRCSPKRTASLFMGSIGSFRERHLAARRWPHQPGPCDASPGPYPEAPSFSRSIPFSGPLRRKCAKEAS